MTPHGQQNAGKLVLQDQGLEGLTAFTSVVLEAGHHVRSPIVFWRNADHLMEALEKDMPHTSLGDRGQVEEHKGARHVNEKAILDV